jgi:hypothetical protein
MSSASASAASSPLFTEEQRLHLQRLGREAEAALIANATSKETNYDGKPWHLQYEKKELELNVYYSTVSNSSLTLFKAECHIGGVTPSQLLTFMSNDELRSTWDQNIKLLEKETIEEEGDWSSEAATGPRSRLIILHCGTKQVSVVSGRDFTDCTLLKYRDDGVCMSAGVGLEPEQLPAGLFVVTSDFVRGLNGKCGWYLEPTPGGTKFTYIIHTDLRGWFFPAVINNLIGGSYATYFEDLKAALKVHLPAGSATK